jgi:hypothetical protein
LKVFRSWTAKADVALHIRGGDHFMQRTSEGRYLKC